MAKILSRVFSRWGLFGKIFIALWGYLALFALVLLLLQQLLRSFSYPVPDSEIPHIERLQQQFERRLTQGLSVEQIINNNYLNNRRRNLFIYDVAQARWLTPTPAQWDEILDHQQTSPQLRHFDNSRIIGPIRLSQPQLRLYVSQPLRDHQLSLLPFLLANPGWLVALLLLLSIPLVAAFAWYLAKPLRSLSHAAGRIAAGDLNTQLPIIHRWDEMGKLSHALSQMVQQLQLAISHQQRLLRDLSHELRSPLTRLQLAARLLQLDNNNQQAQLQLQEEVKRLNQLIDDMLQLSRNEQAPLNLQQQQLPDALETLFNGWQLEADHHQLHLSIHCPELNVVWDPSLMYSAIDNLVRNALRYAQQQIDVSIDVDGQLIISVSDDGPGIPDELRERICQPFYRISDARERHPSQVGTGLGLAITQLACQRHGGQLLVARCPIRQGALVQIRLPAEAVVES